MYLNDDGAAWSRNTGWLGNGDHCTWEGVGCSTDSIVTDLILDNNQLAGPFPTDLMGLSNLQNLNLSGNSLGGLAPNDICSKSTSNNLYINGDGGNCPNDFDNTNGVYLAGCCDNVLIDVDIYLNEFADSEFGDSTCTNLGVAETSVCQYMNNKDNHAIFANGYPENTPGLWDWLKVSVIPIGQKQRC